MRKVSYNLPERVPSITDYFSPSNMTVQELVELLQKVGLENLSEMMMNKTWQLASVMDEVVCSSTNIVNPAKLRRDAEKGTNNRDELLSYYATLN